MSAKEITICSCHQVCECSLFEKVIGQEMVKSEYDHYGDDGLLSDGLCKVTYESGAVQYLRRTWMDLLPQSAGIYSGAVH